MAHKVKTLTGVKVKMLLFRWTVFELNTTVL